MSRPVGSPARALAALLALGSLTVAGPARGQQAAPARDPQPPTVDLPPELERVLRDYERGWRTGDAAALATLFTEDGWVLPSGGAPVRGREAIEQRYRSAGGPLRLRALAFRTDGSVAYIVGAYGYDDREGGDVGKFVLVLHRGMDGRWLIAADIDNGSGGG